MKIEKTFLRNFMTNDILSRIALLKNESFQAERIDFVDKFAIRHDNHIIKLD